MGIQTQPIDLIELSWKWRDQKPPTIQNTQKILRDILCKILHHSKLNMALNSKQKHIYMANLYVFGHREEVNGKLVVTKNHDYPLCADCTHFQGWKMTNSICNEGGVRTSCQANRMLGSKSQASNGCGNEGKLFHPSGKNYASSHEAVNLSKFSIFILGLLILLGLMFL